jgi:hypothetical protein
MSSNSHSPRRNLPKYQCARQTKSKKQIKQTFTHHDFMTFVLPFHENIKKKSFEDFKKMSEMKNFILKKEAYSKWSTELNEKLLSTYQFDDTVEIENVQFDTSLELKKQIKPTDCVLPFYENNKILENYRLPAFKGVHKEYESQVERNNKRRSKILEIISKRARLSGYFCAYDLLCNKLIEMQKKSGTKRKIKYAETDAEMIREYLDRIYEFFDVFGGPDQFKDDEMIYHDIIDDAIEAENEPEIQYFR